MKSPRLLLEAPSGRARRRDGDDVGSYRRQLIVVTGVVAASVALGLVVVVQVVLAGTATEAVGRVLADRAATVADATSASGGGALQVPDALLDPGVAVYDDTGALVAGEIPASLESAFVRISRSSSTRRTEAGDGFEVLARPFATPDGLAGVVVVAEPLAPYEGDEQDALAVSLAAGAVIVVLAVALTAWSSRRVLAPVAEMAHVAEQWSERDLNRRFDLGRPTNEIRALGRTLDGLLEKVAQAILAEQRLTSELAHELRSPLTAIAATAELAAMRDDLDEAMHEDLHDIQESCTTMAATITGLLALARSQSTPAGGDTCDLEGVLDSIRNSVPPGTADVRVQPDITARINAPTALTRRALEPVIDNAVRLADQVTISAEVEGRAVKVYVTDDGPGVPTTTAPDLFEPGRTTGENGTGLGLALARRVARSVGGDVDLADSTRVRGHGATFVITLPLA